MARKPPRVTSTRRQPTTKGGPRVTSTTRQPTTGRGRIVRQPSLGQVFAPSWGHPATPAVPAAANAAQAAAAAQAAPQFSISNLPPDASYDAVLAQLQRQRADALTAITGDRFRGLSDYGFQEGPNGVLTFDPNNPFSKAALLKKAYDTSRRSTGNQMAAGGQLYSGAYQNAQDLVNRNQVQAEDAQQKALQAFLAANTRRRAQVQTDYELQAGQAYGDRVGRFESNPLYDPATGALTPAGAATGPSTAASAPAAPKPKSKPKPKFRPFQPSWRR